MSSKKSASPEPIGFQIGRVLGIVPTPGYGGSLMNLPIRRKAPIPDYMKVRPKTPLSQKASPAIMPITTYTEASPSALIHRVAISKKQFKGTPYPATLKSATPTPPQHRTSPVSNLSPLTLEPATITLKKEASEPEVLTLKKGGMVKKTTIARLHKGEVVVPANKVAKVDKALKKAGLKPLKKTIG